MGPSGACTHGCGPRAARTQDLIGGETRRHSTLPDHRPPSLLLYPGACVPYPHPRPAPHFPLPGPGPPHFSTLPFPAAPRPAPARPVPVLRARAAVPAVALAQSLPTFGYGSKGRSLPRAPEPEKTAYVVYVWRALGVVAHRVAVQSRAPRSRAFACPCRGRVFLQRGVNVMCVSSGLGRSDPECFFLFFAHSCAAAPPPAAAALVLGWRRLPPGCLRLSVSTKSDDL